MKIVFIGGGYASCCTARLLNDLGHEVHIFEKSDSLGGMARTFYKEGMAYEFGPHILANHASDQKVIDFITRYIEMIPTSMETATFLQGQHLNYPPHIDDVPKLSQKKQIENEILRLDTKVLNENNFEAYLISKVGETLYELYFKHFTEKFWMVDPKTLSADWAKLRHLGESMTDKQMFFNKKWCAYPKNDFNELFTNISKNFNIHLNTTISNVDLKTATVHLESGEVVKSDYIVSSLSLDKLLNNKFGELEYRGYDIRPQIIEKESFHPKNPETGKNYSMVYYPEKGVPQTRTTEYKWFNHKADNPEYKNRTIITVEIPTKKAKFYPFMNTENEERLKNYLKEIALYPKVVSLGRMGLYKYTTLDTTTAQVFRFIDNFSTWFQMTQNQRYQSYIKIRGDWSN